MARRNGRKGDWLASDDLTGKTVYGSQLRRGFYGELALKPYKRNLQEIASPLNDPQPVNPYNGPTYETYSQCTIEMAPLYVGNTTVKTVTNNLTFDALALNPGIGEAVIECTFRVA